MDFEHKHNQPLNVPVEQARWLSIVSLKVIRDPNFSSYRSPYDRIAEGLKQVLGHPESPLGKVVHSINLLDDRGVYAYVVPPEASEFSPESDEQTAATFGAISTLWDGLTKADFEVDDIKFVGAHLLPIGSRPFEVPTDPDVLLDDIRTIDVSEDANELRHKRAALFDDIESLLGN